MALLTKICVHALVLAVLFGPSLARRNVQARSVQHRVGLKASRPIRTVLAISLVTMLITRLLPEQATDLLFCLVVTVRCPG